MQLTKERLGKFDRATNLKEIRENSLLLVAVPASHHARRIYKVSVSGVAIERGGLTNLPLSPVLRAHKGPGSGVSGRVRVAAVFLMVFVPLSYFFSPPPLFRRSSGPIV